MRVVAQMLLAAAVIGCQAPTTDSSSRAPISPSATQASASAAPSASLAPGTQILLVGTLTTAAIGGARYSAFVEDGSFYAVWTLDSPPPYLSKLQRFVPPTRTWLDVFVDDAIFGLSRPDVGRLALLEYRWPQGIEVWTEHRVEVLDLRTGAIVKIDAFALSRATFHGGGGGPRGPTQGVVLSGDRVAWSRINELAGGVTEGELRVASMTDPLNFTVIGRSRETIVPLWIDGATLFYQLGGSAQDEIRTRDLATGADRVVAKMIVPAQDRGVGGIARSDKIVGWIENLPTGSTFRTVDVTTGAARDLDLGASTCFGLTGNALGFVWSCRVDAPTALSYFDPRSWKSVEILRSSDRPNTMSAIDGGFMWFDVVNNVRRVNLLVVP